MIQYEKWFPGEADSDGVTRRCGLIYCRNKYTNSEQWCSQNCQFKAPFICEKPANALTSTSEKLKPSVPSPCDENGQFGDTCQYKCHCANGVQCDKTTGVCSSGCAQGWFGPACQYVSISFHAYGSYKKVLGWLTDGLEETCNTDFVKSILVTLGTPTSLTWIRIVVKSAVTHPSRLSPKNVFQLDQSKRRPLVITCNADAVGLPAKFTQLASLQILRKCRWKSEIDNIVDYFVYFPLGVRKNIYNPERHNWDFKFSGAAEDFGPSSRALSIEWTIHDPMWADEGIYICNVTFIDGNFFGYHSGQQDIRARQATAAVENSTNGKKPVPILSETYIQHGKPVTIKCNADAVGLVSNNLPIESLKLSRSLGVSEEETNYTQGSADTVFAYYPRSTNNKYEIITLGEKNSEIRFFSNASKVNVDNSSHVWTIEWTINNPDDILDAGDYECTVRYTNGDNRFRLKQLRTKAGQLNATALTLLSQDFIERGKALVVTCNADVVGISPMNQTVESLVLSRNIEINGSKRNDTQNEAKDTTIIFKQHSNDHKQAIITQDTRNRTFNIISKDLKPDNSTIEWTIHNPDVEDTGNYKCAIKYDDRVADGESRQEQLRAARGNLWNVLLEAKPASQNYEYLEGDEISLSCFAEGPPKLQLHWLSTLENGADSQRSNISQFQVSNISQFQESNVSQFQESNISQFQEYNVSHFQEYNVLQNASVQYYVSKDFESGSYRHTSVLTLKLGLADNGTVLSCEAQNNQHSEQSISIVLKVFDNREGRGRSITATSENNVKRVDELIRQDTKLKLHEIANSLEISETSAHRIVFDELGYRKVSARWVPKQLTDNHKEQRLDICREHLRRSKSSHRVLGHTANAGGDFLGYDVTFLDSIVTGDETWLHHCTPETMQDLMTWKHPSSPVTKKFKVMRLAKKTMGTVFWDSRGVLLFETLQPGETINAARYCQTLDKLREAIRRKRPGQLTNGVNLQHDNATPHTARVTQGWLEKYGWEILPHPPHSPDLAPSDYHLFRPLKRELAGKRFDDDEELVEHVRKWLQNLDGSFFREGIFSMVRRW
ncbi:histone-lysine N-methyltransferase SETMAR [Elysia marginata]|uniref:Histone-lysine N-methyltransferase SETMAR n=1 Tax=Elysia marginata TaxID=1093978 RepID=A0AAV4J0N3_9GAST|nr:histone-lysine N-methyltransferase SETMAR [Elysia marginata]